METECLVIGSGIAGATCALTAADSGLDVTLITKRSKLCLTNTESAQGGIVYRGEADSADLLSRDIVRAGRGINSKTAVDFLSSKGPDIVKKILIDKLGVKFNHIKGSGHDNLDLTMEGAHSVNRILFSDDHTGHEIEQELVRAVMGHDHIRVLIEATSIDLITLQHHSSDIQARYILEDRCLGAYVFMNDTKEVDSIFAQFTVLATGGLGDIYLHSTNARGTVGDGIVMAQRAGARVLNLEYMQFHPTTLYIPGKRRFLISEAVRGEGARIKNLKGEYFMSRYNPELRDLAPRDEVTVAIWDEMLLNHYAHVFLDVRNFVKDDIQERFPSIYSACMDQGIDITKEDVPVVPAAHYCCGGVHVDIQGRTSLRGLYAVGEVSCTGLHGANRLASTSLLEGVTWGYFAAMDIKKRIDSGDTTQAPMMHSVRDWIPTGNVENEDPALLAQDWMSLKSTMWNYVGIVRTTPRLKRALEDLRHMYLRINDFYRETPVSKDIISLFHGTQSAIMVADAALRNKSSIGCHFIRQSKGSSRSFPAMSHDQYR
ncbi:MAG: FAD-dependent oxidoreductase [Thermodesulfobacteriota bacterium]|nr:FAD-dependent oxidoreductase [Thermodesulfobacteriota bacterium]